MRFFDSQVRRGFTLIELLVVVAIIALLISILLPSLSCARNQARAAKCGVQLRALGTGLTTYFIENRDWIPGVNTTGLNFYMEYSRPGQQLPVLRSSKSPVQNYDWITPILKLETQLGNNRAERFGEIVNRYQCPSQAGLKIDTLYAPGLAASADQADFRDIPMAPLSYQMPAHFQFWGQTDRGRILYQQGAATYPAQTGNPAWEVVVPKYRSKMNEIGTPGRKIMVVDGTRYLDGDELDFDPAPFPTNFGSFTTQGGWWSGSIDLGVRGSTLNWDGQAVGQGSPSDGKNLALSYRHGCASGQVPTDVQSNKGSVNALFFDGHVARLNDRQSREIEYWYPRGATVTIPAEGLTRVQVGYQIP